MMYRRPYPYEQANFDDPNQLGHHYYHQSNQQPFHNNLSPYQYTSGQTPFEYFEKPRQPTHWPNEMQQYQYPEYNQPIQPFNQSNILAQFKDQNGQVDINKTLSTVGQFANTVQQVTPVIKQISDLLKSFR